MSDTRDPDVWSRIDQPTVRRDDPQPDLGLCLRSGDLLHRISLRHGGTVTEPASW